MKRVQRQRDQEAGLTLVELMISVLLASTLTAGAFFMLSGQTQTYNREFNMSTLQSQVWGSMQLVRREIQRAGYGFPGCPNNATVMRWDGNNPAGTVVAFRGLQVFNDCDLSTTNPTACPDGSGSDSLSVMYQNAEPAIGGMAGLRLANANLPSSDPAFSPQVSSTGNFQAGDFMVLWNPLSTTQTCVVLRVTGLGAGPPTLLHATPGAGFNPPGGVGNNIFTAGYPQGSSVVRLSGNSTPRFLAVDRSTSPPRLVTWRTWNANPSSDTANLEVVADGIEDLQIATACDVDTANPPLHEGTDGAGDPRSADEWANNVPADVPPACGAVNVGAVRVTLIGRSANAIESYKQGFLPAAEDRIAGTPAQDLAATGQLGTYTRTVMTATIQTMNLR